MTRPNLLLIVLGLAFLAASGYALNQQRQTQAYNQNLETNQFIAMEDDSLEGEFIRGWRHQIGGEFTQARAVYNAILHRAPSSLSNKIQFNLANIYMQQAIHRFTDSDSENDDSAYPLVELSKHIYRKLLIDKIDHWPAKYNLEIAVKIAPDVLVTDIPEDILPERSPENQGVIEEYKKLP
ncbi:MAG: hypothetical protein KTR18_14360 [Acidiferrobacterales bacterium]|nr:hypothetical protein [Acidiferrobacterales bacterium]